MADNDRPRVANAPDYRIVVDGQVITPPIRGRLISLTLTDERGGEADQLDLELSDHDGRLALPRKGARIELALGWQSTGLVERGSYTVDEIEHQGAPDRITVRARSADMRESLPGKRTESWDELTVGEILDAIAQRHELEPRIGERLAGREIAHIDQTEESDLNFLTRLGQRFDAVAAVKAGKLLFIAAGEAATAAGLTIPAITITRADGDNHRYSDTDRDSYPGVIATWRDVNGAEKREAVAGTKDGAKRLRPIFGSEEDALDAAESEWGRIQRGDRSLSLTLAKGRAALYPETPATMVGFKAEIDATPWLTTRVEHRLTDSSYTNNVEFEVAGG